jgi:aminopeptidase N
MDKIEPIYLKDYKKPAFSIESVELIFDIYDECVVVTNIMKVLKVDLDIQHLKLDSIDLELLEIKIDGIKLKESGFEYKDEVLTVFNVTDSFSIKIINKLYPSKNTELEGLYRSGDIFCTQNEPEGFRRITPYIDRPDIMSVFKTTIIADKTKYPILLSNGNKVQCHDSFHNNRHGVTWFDPHKKPSYLFALVAGDLDVLSDEFITKSGNVVELNIYCDIGNKDKTHHAMKSLKEAMLWDEQNYNREYDLSVYNIVAVDSFNMGAMENKGLNIFNSAYVLADNQTATDTNFMGIQSVIAHEYFHNWTGNRITCRDWFQLTLKEGLTVFRDQCFSADMNSKDVARIEDVKALKERQFVEDSSPMAHPIQPKSYISMNNFYTSTVYEKGAEVIRMIHTLIGKEKFYNAMQIYFDKFDGQAITTDDFLWAMSKGGDIDLTQFRRWYDQVKTPKLIVKESYSNSTYRLNLTQDIEDDLDSNPQKPYFYPLKIALIDSKTKKEVLQKVLIISKESEEFVFENLENRVVLSINRDFSAPIIIKQDQIEHLFLMKYDTNSFTRYESAQTYALEVIYKMLDNKPIDKEYLEAFGYLLDLEDIDMLYKALLLELPSVSTITQSMKNIDFLAVLDVLDSLKYKIALQYRDKFLDIYYANHSIEDELSTQAIAKRAVKNRALKYLKYLKDDEEIIKIAYKQYYESKTMTDTVVALEVLEELNEALAKDVFKDFYNKYKNNSLVMSKYFSILASANKKDTLNRVIKLQSDLAYDEKVPNLVRSLIGSFTRNYRYFHAKDGSGYRFLADKIIEIDKINAQMASSLANAFKLYDRLNELNKKMMKKELDRLISLDNLSKNSYEIIYKIVFNLELIK